MIKSGDEFDNSPKNDGSEWKATTHMFIGRPVGRIWELDGTRQRYRRPITSRPKPKGEGGQMTPQELQAEIDAAWKRYLELVAMKYRGMK